MKAVPISDARRLGQDAGARRLVIIYSDGVQIGFTSWGKTRAECDALGEWIKSEEAQEVGDEIVNRWT